MAHDHLTDLLDLDAEVLHEYYREVIDWVGREAAERPRVIDLGAGTGTGTLALARELPDADVIALDVDAEMLNHMQDKADAAGLADRIRTVQADLDQPWPDLGRSTWSGPPPRCTTWPIPATAVARRSARCARAGCW